MRIAISVMFKIQKMGNKNDVGIGQHESVEDKENVEEEEWKGEEEEDHELEGTG